MTAPPTLVDSHAHLDSSRFDVDREEVIDRALDSGISHMLTIGCDLASSRRSIEIALGNPNIYAAVGIHPHDAAEATEEGIALLEALIEEGNKVVAIGEIGLDYYRDRAPRDVQRQAFRRQIRLAKKLSLPIIVHDREAHEEVMDILREEGASEVGGVLHCFSGDLAMARTCIEIGFLISFPGTITYPKNEAAREVVRSIPIDHMLIETDCPYLSAQPKRGKRNEPAFVRYTAEKIAEIKGLTVEDVARVTSRNAFNLFGIGQPDESAKIAYKIRNSLYLNITNRCTNSCSFCAKFKDLTVKGHHLGLEHEPTAEEVKFAVGDPTLYDEIVFCGYGEPLLRLDLVVEIAGWLKEKGLRVRINTDGQANIVHGRNILPDLSGLIDAVSVSLNAPDAESYQRICRSELGPAAYQGVKDFLLEAKKHISSVTASAVTVPGIDIEACRKIAVEELGVNFLSREYNEVG